MNGEWSLAAASNPRALLSTNAPADASPFAPHKRITTSASCRRRKQPRTCAAVFTPARRACVRFLPSIPADAPAALAHGRFDGCAACTEANATRHIYGSSQYKPASYAGRLIHADITGPIVRTHHVGY
eukprot:6174677-Pleurochrysis_carterae.AAC.5